MFSLWQVFSVQLRFGPHGNSVAVGVGLLTVFCCGFRRRTRENASKSLSKLWHKKARTWRRRSENWRKSGWPWWKNVGESTTPGGSWSRSRRRKCAWISRWSWTRDACARSSPSPSSRPSETRRPLQPKLAFSSLAPPLCDLLSDTPSCHPSPPHQVHCLWTARALGATVVPCCARWNGVLCSACLSCHPEERSLAYFLPMWDLPALKGTVPQWIPPFVCANYSRWVPHSCEPSFVWVARVWDVSGRLLRVLGKIGKCLKGATVLLFNNVRMNCQIVCLHVRKVLP